MYRKVHCQSVRSAPIPTAPPLRDSKAACGGLEGEAAERSVCSLLAAVPGLLWHTVVCALVNRTEPRMKTFRSSHLKSCRIPPKSGLGRC